MEADEDPENSSNVILLYTGRSQDKTFNASSSNDDDAWNREHVWAKSRGDFGTDPAAGSDAHHLRPADAQYEWSVEVTKILIMGVIRFMILEG